MSELEQLQQNLDTLVANLDKISKAVDNLHNLYDQIDNPTIDEPIHWVNYIFPPGSNLLRYKCSNCGYISTFKTLSCPRCKESVKG